MNILTKISVVILLVLVLVASTVFINMAVVSPNWKYYYDQEKLRAAYNAQNARLQQLALLRVEQERKDAERRRDELAAQVAKLQQEKLPTPAQLLVAEMKGKLDQFETSLKEQVAVNDAMNKRNELLVGQLDDKRKKIDELETNLRDARVEMVQTQGKLERSERVVQALQRQLQDRDERIRELELTMQRGPVTAAPGGTVATSAGVLPRVEGAITAVRGDLASINIGAAQGIKQGMKLYIYRDARFVGYLRVMEVQDGEAAGEIVDRQVDPIPGDKITNDLLK